MMKLLLQEAARHCHKKCTYAGFQILLLSVLSVVPARGVEFQYHHNHRALERTLRNFTSVYPDITHMYSVGKSVMGRKLWVLVVGKHAAKPALLVPNVKYIANMHGNEVVGRELLFHLADHYLTQYGKNETLTRFLDMTRVHLMPSMNPDGFSKSRPGCTGVTGRGNAFMYDLNRNFPDSASNEPMVQQKEVTNVLNWILSTNFVLSANLHGGTLVVNYPFDSYPGDVNLRRYAPSPDDDVFRHLALTYSRSHHSMYMGANCGDTFEEGIVNGASWYPITGGMQDFMYHNASGYEVLIEMSCCKYPRASLLPELWENNRDALINFLLQVHMGVKGLIYGQSLEHSDVFSVVERAAIGVVGRGNVIFHSSALGEYHKLLLPGQYTLLVSHPSFEPKSIPFTVISEKVTRLDVKLMRALRSTKDQTTGTTGRFDGEGARARSHVSNSTPIVSVQDPDENNFALATSRSGSLGIIAVLYFVRFFVISISISAGILG